MSIYVIKLYIINIVRHENNMSLLNKMIWHYLINKFIYNPVNDLHLITF